jgi:phosphoglycolate phosphatase
MNVQPDDEAFPALREQFLNDYEAEICVKTKLFPGMAELVDSLDANDIRWGIVTNKPHRFTLPLMAELGYQHRASCIVSGDTCAKAKPHPEPLLYAASLLGVKPAQCLYLGDDLRDMEAANAAGMMGIIARYGYIDVHADLATCAPRQHSISRCLVADYFGT